MVSQKNEVKQERVLLEKETERVLEVISGFDDKRMEIALNVLTGIKIAIETEAKAKMEKVS